MIKVLVAEDRAVARSARLSCRGGVWRWDPTRWSLPAGRRQAPTVTTDPGREPVVHARANRETRSSVRETSLRLLLHGLGWCALGVVLLHTLIRLGVLAEDFRYKGAVVFTVTVLGVMFSRTRLKT